MTEARPAWPSGEGEMASLIREFNWASTPIGPVELWPAPLRSAVQFILPHALPMAVLWGPDLIQTYNDGYRGILGERHPNGLGQSTRQCWAESFPSAASLLERVRQGETITLQDAPFIFARPDHSGDMRLTITCNPLLREEGGAADGILVTVIDTTKRNPADPARLLAEAAVSTRDRREQILAAELQHRVRNILTVVRSVFSRTVEAGGDFEEIVSHFRGRLDALARTQLIVTKNAEGQVDLEDLIRDELLSAGVSDGPNVTIEGPTVLMPSLIAESMGLALHELTTNAIKFGALRVPRAKLSIRWNIVKCDRLSPRLVLVWQEKGVPVVVSGPIHEGFGRELIEEALPYRLEAETRLEFRPGGVRCEISLSLPNERIAAKPEEAAR